MAAEECKISNPSLPVRPLQPDLFFNNTIDSQGPMLPAPSCSCSCKASRPQSISLARRLTTANPASHSMLYRTDVMPAYENKSC